MCKEDPKRLKFVSLCAANAGVKDVQSVVTAAKTELRFGRRTILFMDEIHRFNKRQQDSFLIHVERGDIVLIDLVVVMCLRIRSNSFHSILAGMPERVRM